MSGPDPAGPPPRYPDDETLDDLTLDAAEVVDAHLEAHLAGRQMECCIRPDVCATLMYAQRMVGMSRDAVRLAARRTVDMHRTDEPGQAGRCRGCSGLPDGVPCARLARARVVLGLRLDPDPAGDTAAPR